MLGVCDMYNLCVIASYDYCVSCVWLLYVVVCKTVLRFAYACVWLLYVFG